MLHRPPHIIKVNIAADSALAERASHAQRQLMRYFTTGISPPIRRFDAARAGVS